MTHHPRRLQRLAPFAGATWLTVALSIAASGCKSEPVQVTVGLDRGEQVFDTCAPCHMPNGSGQELVAAPAIAGMPEWYLKAQLEKFKSGVRGAHFDDLEGARMRPMARTLELEGELESVAMYVAQMPATKPEATVEGDVAKGKVAFATCAACHGAAGEGNEATKGPALAGQSDWYLVRQIEKFKTGLRGANAEDTTGVQMQAMANTLADDQAVRDVVAYINTLKQ